jgi:hypothetical protein
VVDDVDDDDDDDDSVLVCKKQTAAKAQPKISGPLVTMVRTALVMCCATSSGLCSSMSCTKLMASCVDSIISNLPSWFDERRGPLFRFVAMLIMRGNEAVVLPRSDNRCIIFIMAPPLLLLRIPLGGPFELAVASPRERCIIILMGCFVSYASTLRESANAHNAAPPFGPRLLLLPHAYAGN